HQMNEIAITCLPANIPEYIEIDVANLEIGQTLHLSDITLPKGITSDELAKGESHDQAVVSLNAPKVANVDSEEASEEASAE
ncbi:MAG: large subunit ribosomal protein L25, partial [Psychroserpens sp.]